MLLHYLTANTPDYNIYSTINPPILQQQILGREAQWRQCYSAINRSIIRTLTHGSSTRPLALLRQPAVSLAHNHPQPGAAHDILISSAVSTNSPPSPSGGGQPPASTSTSGIGNGTLIFAATLWWCGAGGSVATFGLRRTEVWSS